MATCPSPNAGRSTGTPAGITPDVYKRETIDTVERYNKMCEAGVDTDFYKTADKLISIGAVSYTHLDVYKRQTEADGWRLRRTAWS